MNKTISIFNNLFLISAPPSPVTSPKHSTLIGREAQSIQLSWNDPSDLGNGRISELTYQVQWCNLAACNETVVSGTTLSLENLENGTSYNVTITPINALGAKGLPFKMNFSTQKQDCE